jgi:hypothetical protein
MKYKYFTFYLNFIMMKVAIITPTGDPKAISQKNTHFLVISPKTRKNGFRIVE